jgi:hypothetical protein
MIDINEEYKDMTFDDVIDDGTSWELANWKGDIPQVVLFKGPYGCGKNLLAYLFAKKIENVDINVRNTVDNTAKGAEELITQYSSPPFVPDMHQVCVLNEFTMFRKDAMGKFKDAFQAPPKRTYFFVCTNEPEVIPEGVCLVSLGIPCKAVSHIWYRRVRMTHTRRSWICSGSYKRKGEALFLLKQSRFCTRRHKRKQIAFGLRC